MRVTRQRWCKDRLKWDFQDNLLFMNRCTVLPTLIGVSAVDVASKRRLHTDCLKRSVKFKTSDMVWACMSAAGLEKLRILSGRVNFEEYVEVIAHFMINHRKIYFRGNF
ncbi:hypothetical protein NPIL_355171 [Nephila pilipes]|uniref:Uncharacterized protein n=1 Tax=Nephila pilipes TaxID=299642 RepID=A0A8X6NCS5_NEPPI|nr:hypothetical protein NPIL_355171 [Nephila pilipes]